MNSAIRNAEMPFNQYIYTDPVFITSLDEPRPSSTGGGDGDGSSNVIAIVVPVVVGPFLLCCVCLLLVLLLLFILLARRKGSGGGGPPSPEEPDYRVLAYGRLLEPQHSASKKQVASLKRLEEVLSQLKILNVSLFVKLVNPPSYPHHTAP